MNENNQNKGAAHIAVAAVVLLALLGGWFYFASSRESREAVREEQTGGAEQTSESAGPKVIAGAASPLLDYRKADYDEALNSGKPIFLYFYANWCPICKEETANALYPAFNEFNQDGLVGFRVNYKDNETDENEVALAREFGVGYQHTKVLIKDGKAVLKSPESWDKARYLAEMKKLVQ